MKNPLDPFSKVLDEQSHWDPEWYSWLTELTSTITALQSAVTTLQGTSPPGMVFISSQNVTSPVGSLVFSGLNSTIYEAYKFSIIGLKPTADSTTLGMQMSVNNGVSWLNTSNGWVWNYNDASNATGNWNATQAADLALIWLANPISSTWGCHVDLTVYPSVTGAQLNSATWQAVLYHPLVNGTRMLTGGITEQSNAAPVNAVKFFFGAGNITTGRITLYGLRKT